MMMMIIIIIICQRELGARCMYHIHVSLYLKRPLWLKRPLKEKNRAVAAPSRDPVD